MTLGSGGDLLQHRGRRGKVRCSLVEVGEVAWVELTEVAVKTAAAATILREPDGAPAIGLDKR
jgi:hypothetical protein